MSQLFRSWRPLYNPIGFGAADFIVLAWAGLLVLLLVAVVRCGPAASRFARRTRWSMLVLALLPILLRLALLPTAPVPEPRTPDDFSFALLGDTLAHFRLANPPHPMHRFFETNFVLQEPTYSSIYPLGQGIALAFGQLVLRRPWAGVVVCAGAFCGLCYWMLRAWTTPAWALIGGLLAVFEFGPLQHWMNTYWGGSLAAAGGCLIFGALPRLHHRASSRDAALLGVGLAVEWLTRPFETALILLCMALFLVPAFRGRWRLLARTACIAALVALPALALALLQNRQVTGHWTTLPYVLSQYQYGIPTSFTLQPVPTPHRPLTGEQKIDYDLQSAVHGNSPDSFSAFLDRLGKRVRFYRFFFPVPLLLALPAFFPALGQLRFLWVGISLAILGLGANFYPYFYPHYIAGGACLFVLVSVTALERVSRWSRETARLILLLSAAQFLFWYGLHLLARWEPARVLTEEYESWDYVNHGDPEGRIAIDRRLAQAGGKQLVFVRYGPQHRLDQWVSNAADIDSSAIVRALDLGPAEDENLRRYYPDRTAWLLEPDARPPRLEPYRPEPPKAAPAAPAPVGKNKSPFEEVPGAPAPSK
jgi:hypothetical protein